MMVYLYLAIALVGAVTAGWGLRSAHRIQSPWDNAAALTAVVGLVTFIIGILLAVLPDFFIT